MSSSIKIGIRGNFLSMCAAAALLTGASPAQVSARNAHVREAPLEVITLGTGGGPVLRKQRAQPSNALVAGNSIYLVDVGDGVLQRLAQANIGLPDVTGIFITHLHIDHTGSLDAIIGIRYHLGIYSRLTVYGPPGTKALVDALVAAHGPIDAVSTAPARGKMPELRDTVEVVEVVAPQSGDEVRLPPVSPFDRIVAVKNSHFDNLPADRGESLSFRFERGGKSVVFTGDTGPSKAVERLATNSDLMIGELVDMEAWEKQLSKMTRLPQSSRDAILESFRRYHLTPRALGEMAANAATRRLVASHIIPGTDGDDEKPSLKEIRRYYTGNVVVAHDLDRFYVR